MELLWDLEEAGSPTAAKAMPQRALRSQARRRAAGFRACTRKSPAEIIISSPLPSLSAALSCSSSHSTQVRLSGTSRHSTQAVL